MNTSPQKLIHLQQLTKTYGQGSAAFKALKGIDLTIHQGEFVSIMGPSGSGKSTLMNLLVKRSMRHTMARDALAQVGLPDKERNTPAELSGGQQHDGARHHHRCRRRDHHGHSRRRHHSSGQRQHF